MKFRTKLLLIMRLTTLCIFCFCLQISARVSSQTVTLKVSHGKLESVLNEFTRQTSYFFIYNDKSMKLSVPVTIDLKETAITEALYQLFRNQPLSYVIKGKNVVIEKKSEKANPGIVSQEVSPEILNPPPVTVHGRVTNENGEPVAGATIAIKGGQAIGTTDGKGEYTVTVPDGNVTLVFSAITIETVEMKVNGRTELNVHVKMRVSQLQEVEVVNKGYYSIAQKYNTGNVTKIKGEDIQKQPVSDPLQALEGRVPGLYIQQTSGLPGAYGTVQLRGQNSMFNPTSKPNTLNNPLYIVDGVPYGSAALTSSFIGGGAVGNPANATGQGAPALGLSPFNNINTADIESIEVLKDADATAIYGSRGANGVILITTKKGKAGKTKVDFNIYSGGGKVTRKLDMLNTQQYLAMRHEAFNNDNKVPGPNDYDINGTWDTTRYTDWQKVLIGNTTHFTNAQVNISGGNKNTQFLIGGGYSQQGVVYPGDYYDKKASLHFNLTHTSENQRFQALFSASYMNDNNNLPNTDLTSQIVLAPDAPAIYNPDGTLNWQLKNNTNTWQNPLKYTVQTDNSKTKNLIGNVNLSYRLLPGLDIKSNLGYTYSEMDQANMTPATFYTPQIRTSTSRAIGFANTQVQTWIIEPQLNYHKKISKGALDVLLGTTFQENTFQSIAYSASGFANDGLISNPANASSFNLTGNQQTIYRYNAVFGRIGYSWQDKYLVNFIGRRDGSSRFGPGRQFGNFGAIGGAWIFSKEPFIQNSLPFLSFGKLRVSYGSTGNDNIKDFQYLSTYSSVSSTYQNVTAFNPTQLTNPDFRWERVDKLEGGLELSFLQDRINFSVSYYHNRTSDQLVSYPLPYITGYPNVQGNLPAIVQNTGVEFILNTINVRSRNFVWSSAVNLTIPQTKLVSYPDFQNSPYKSVYAVGQSLFIFQKYHVTGVDPQTGLYTFTTQNANGTPSAVDNVITKPVTQQFYGGWQNSFNYKGFQLDVLVQFVKQIGFDYRFNFVMPGAYNSGSSNQPVYILDRWQQANDNTAVMKFSTGQPAQGIYNTMRNSSDLPITNASFIRLKNLSLSYNFPGNWMQKLHLQNARVYLQCQNLFTITGYKGLDPETGGLNLPPLRMITGGIQFTL